MEALISVSDCGQDAVSADNLQKKNYFVMEEIKKYCWVIEKLHEQTRWVIEKLHEQTCEEVSE